MEDWDFVMFPYSNVALITPFQQIAAPSPKVFPRLQFSFVALGLPNPRKLLIAN
jgi:hypothetical protein